MEFSFTLISIFYVIKFTLASETDTENQAKILYPNLFNISYIKEKTHNYEHFSVYLKETPEKGIGVYARKRILPNRVVLFYKLKIFDERKNRKPLSNGEYSFVVHTIINEKFYVNVFKYGDLYEKSNQKPRGRKPFWGYLANEPSLNQTKNVYCDRNWEENYKFKTGYKEGQILYYKLISSRIIEPDEEITWCYGMFYKNKYEKNCDQTD
ncbi:unnamed protein product [Brachionus calyciflorus]|uniref:SET domain-containing protein n=1 Tax=Brachionus calyciflorus TaxID=104777 RepID=A0A814E6F8_9BILA|nr:unnamed protein product [Brachionus calyciflorus]